MAARKRTAEREWKPVRQFTPGGAAPKANPAYDRELKRAKAELPIALRALMQRRGITPAQLGGEMGLSAGAVKHRLSGRTDFGAAELRALAEILQVPVSSLFDLSELLSHEIDQDS